MSDEEEQSEQGTGSQAVAKAQEKGTLLGKRKTQGGDSRAKDAQAKR